MDNWLRFFTDIDHPSMAGMKKQVEMYFRAGDIALVEDIYEQGTGKSGVKFAVTQNGQVMNVVGLIGYTARSVVEAIVRADTYLQDADSKDVLAPPRILDVARSPDAPVN
jgi:hypothetical protein